MKKMRSNKLLAVCTLMVLILIVGLSARSEAALEVRGTDNLGKKLIYDTDLNITWYDYTRGLDVWENQNSWANNLTVNFMGNNYSDWTLSWSTCGGVCSDSEADITHLSYIELGNPSGGPATNTGPFDNLLFDNFYWTAKNFGGQAYMVSFSGRGGPDDTGSNAYGLAVMAGDVTVVPEPISAILFVTGGSLLAGRIYLRTKKKA